MRIGINEIILNGQSDGTRQRELNVLKALDTELMQRGHELVIFLAADSSEELKVEIKKRCQHAIIKVTAVPSRPVLKRALGGLFSINKLADAYKLTCMHSSYCPLPRMRCPQILTVNDLRYLKFPETYPWARRKFLEWTVPRAIQRAEVVLAISEYTKEEICQAYGVPREKVIVALIPHDPRFSRRRDTAQFYKIREKLGVPERFLLTVGHLEPRKNHRRIFKAFSGLVRAGYRDVGLVVVGTHSYQWLKIMNEATLAGVEKNVIFTGRLSDEDLICIYNMATALVFPSLHEGFGIPALEAMGCGTPVIASNTTALPEVVGDAAILVNPDSVDQIGSAMRQVITDTDYAVTLSAKGILRAKAFDPIKTAGVLADAYERFA